MVCRRSPHCVLPILCTRIVESRKRLGPTETSVSQIISVDVESRDRKQHTSGPGMKVSPQWLNADRVAYVKKQGSDPGLSSPREKKELGVNFAIPPGPRMEHASCITGNCS